MQGVGSFPHPKVLSNTENIKISLTEVSLFGGFLGCTCLVLLMVNPLVEEKESGFQNKI